MKGAAAERLIAAAQAARMAPHGSKESIYSSACADLGISRATLHRKLKELTVTVPRKRRSDAGKTALTREEARLIAGIVMESQRQKYRGHLCAIGKAVDDLRADGKIRAASVNPKTGEIKYLSYSAISRAMYKYGVHPAQLSAPAPATELKSLHPNHVWELDASMCVLYYLNPQADGGNGLNIMLEKDFNKNKPRNLARIAANRVWSYEITDHTSGWIYVEYVMGAESGENLCNVLINAMQDRGGADVMHGIPKILFTDPGAANLSSMTRNLCLALGIRQIAHKPGNPRPTGQVENARKLIQNDFESGLRFRPIHNIDDLNEHAMKWRAWYNRNQVHSRHGKTRTEGWMMITEEQLVKAPPVDVCRTLAASDAKTRQVSRYMTISFKGKEYDVSTVPDVMVNQELLITLNPWRKDSVQAVIAGKDGRDEYHVCPAVSRENSACR
ncbi:MAG: DDE-type integrase/transposase/recombinase [Oxalobacter formigenes]|nr:DDE-type integrase/transposase/recombinase [Oxalobacter formigenes]